MPENPFEFLTINLNFGAISVYALAAISLWAAGMGLIYMYHSHHYGAGTSRAIMTDVVYFAGLLVLIGLASSLHSLL
jgi:hypothetical protein